MCVCACVSVRVQFDGFEHEPPGKKTEAFIHEFEHGYHVDC